MISEPQRPGASEVCFAIGEKSAGNSRFASNI